MTLNAQITADLSMFFNTDDFGVAVTYTPVGGAGVSRIVIITYGEGEDYQGADALNIEAIMEILANSTSGVATVGVGDSVTIGTETWKVIGAEKVSDGLIWSCIISRMNR